MKDFSFSPKKIKKFIFDHSIDIKKRAFVLFSFLVLASLFAAVPCGLIMREPLSATISTVIGAIFFSIYVYYSIKKDRIDRARIALSIILIFLFLPAMFFTNGGVSGGTPIWLLLETIYIAMILDGTMKKVMLILEALVMVVCWIIGYYFPATVTEYSRAGNYFDTLTALFIVSAIVYSLISFQMSLYRKDEEDKNLKRLFEQTATALVNAIDAKDEYTHGHSARVAEYSKKIAEMSGKTPAECEEIYYAALLHDVGKIGISEDIINKKGRLNDEEYMAIKQHPGLGAQILRSINEYPNLLTGANYHHERYDGRGYPNGLKGEDIPEIARIISVADAYDAMTSSRSYRETIPQQAVREEIVKGSGTQFDPKYAKVMQHLIDMDTEYKMRERSSIKELSGKSELYCDSLREEVSGGILIGPDPTIKKIRLKSESIDKKAKNYPPSIILFDSLDERYHDQPRDIEDLNYFEYAQIDFNGKYEISGARKVQVDITEIKKEKTSSDDDSTAYDIEAVKIKDHIQITISGAGKAVKIIIALPDKSRFAYIGLTGENCHIYDVNITSSEETVPEDYITRIAEELTYIDVPEGDIPNVQIDGYRTDSTVGIPIRDGLKITFHTMSLPTARLVWHCPYIDLFYSPDKKPCGDGYKEYSLIRIDGESWEAERIAQNKLIVNISDDFNGWDEWKDDNKKGFDSTVSFKIEDDKIITYTENLGVSIKVMTTIIEPSPEIYVCLTGDQCALTNIRISES